MILRRNNIGDEGAEYIAQFIEKNERNFKNLEISRNKITDIGGYKIL